MKVLSLFDGMACGMLAMQSAGVSVSRYVAFEIDKYAVQTSSHNFPMIEHRGDVFQADFTEFLGFDFLVGGSPCTYWSIAQKNNRETEASGMGWELFSQYVRALKEAQPMYFIYENNKSMSNAIRESITHTFGFEPICINSALVSAQNRQRLYWVGKRNPNGTYSRVRVEQPKDRGILLRDVLDGAAKEAIGIGYRGRMEDGKWVKQYESNGEQKANAITTATTDSMVAIRIPEYGIEDKARPLGANYSNNCGGFEHRLFSEKPNKQQVDLVAAPVRVGTYPNDSKNPGHDSQQYRIYSTDGKGVALCGNGGGMGAKTGLYALPVGETKEGKSFAVTAYYSTGQNAPHTLEKHKGSMAAECVPCYAIPCEYDDNGRPIKAISGTDGKTYDVFEVKDGFITIKGKQYPIKLADGFYIIRKLTVSECKRLQTVPEWYEFPVSDTQAYKMLGNGWTIEVIAHLVDATQADELEEEQLDLFRMVGVN